MRHLACTILVFVFACGSPPRGRQATPEEVARLYPWLAVRISKAEPPPGCEPMGTVTAGGGSIDAAYEGLQRQAAKRKANYVVLDGVAYNAFGRAFRCPEILAHAADQAVSTTLCEPECSPGFSCVRGTCVSACNPPCDKSQRCGADRACHAVQ